MMATTVVQRREKRAKQTAEVFTPSKLVKQMLDKLPKEVWQNGKTFVDPAAGNGNFLVHVLYRKLSRGHDSLDALQSVYGVDIMQDNVQLCRLRLLRLIEVINDEEITEDHIKAVFDNIKWLCTKRFPNGSLNYDFGFKKGKHNQKTIDKWMKWINEGKLDEIDLPVDSETCQQKHKDIFAE